MSPKFIQCPSCSQTNPIDLVRCQWCHKPLRRAEPKFSGDDLHKATSLRQAGALSEDEYQALQRRVRAAELDRALEPATPVPPAPKPSSVGSEVGGCIKSVILFIVVINLIVCVVLSIISNL